MPTLSSLRAFEAAARWCSFKDAAVELGVTPTSISHQVRSLEDQLGVGLFDRLNRRVALTQQGTMFAATLSSAFDAIDTAARDLRVARAEAEPAESRLVIVGNPGFIDCWLHARLIGFRRGHPDRSLEIIPDDATEHHLRNRADLAIHYGFAPPQAFESEHLSTTAIFPVCSPRLIEGAHALRQPHDLAHHTLLHESSTQFWKRWLTEAGCSDSVEGGAGSVFHTSALVMDSAVAGEGVALTDGLIAGDHLLAGRLVKPFAHVSKTTFSCYLVFASGRRDRAEVRAFRDWLLAQTQDFKAVMEHLARPESFISPEINSSEKL
jgi:LysR family glycine cleavage system transcriptional activator